MMSLTKLALVDEFEKKLGFKLPLDYKQLLLSHLEGCPLNKLYRTQQETIEMRFLLGFSEDYIDIRDCLDYIATYTRENMLPIINDMGGQFICIALSGPNANVLYRTDGFEFFHYDCKVTFEYLCPSFTHFWDKLENAEELILTEFEKLAEFVRVEQCERVFAGRDVNERDKKNFSLIEVASCAGNVEVVKWCLSKNADVGNSLNDAFFSCQWTIVEVLIGLGLGTDPRSLDPRRGVRVENSQLDVPDRERWSMLMARAAANVGVIWPG